MAGCPGAPSEGRLNSTGETGRTAALGATGVRVALADRQPTFWARVERGAWEPHTLAAVAAIAGPGMAFLDVGAWVGPTALLAAARGARVLALEPDPAAREQLLANLAANPDLRARVAVSDRALAAGTGPVRLGARRKPGDSMSSVLFEDAPEGWLVPTVTVDALAADLSSGEPLLAKVDVEGAEYDVGPLLPRLGEGRPFALLLSLHPGLYAEARGPQALRDAAGRLAHAFAGYAALCAAEGAWLPAEASRGLQGEEPSDWLLFNEAGSRLVAALH